MAGISVVNERRMRSRDVVYEGMPIKSFKY